MSIYITSWLGDGEFRVMLWLTVSLSVRLGVKPHLGLMTILYINVPCQSLCPTVFQHPLWWESGLFFVSLRSNIYVFTNRLTNTQTVSISPDLVRCGSEVHSHTNTCSSLSAASKALAGNLHPRIPFSFYLIYWPSHKEIRQLKVFILFNIRRGEDNFNSTLSSTSRSPKCTLPSVFTARDPL